MSIYYLVQQYDERVYDVKCDEARST